MAKKGNKKKSNARKTQQQQQKKVVTTPTATTAPATPEESSPVTPVNALGANDKALLTEEPQVAAAEKEIEQIKKEEEKPVVAEKKEQVQEQEESAEKPSILSNASEEALASTSENIVESLQVKDTLEEPPHVEVKAEPVAVVLDSLPESEQPVVITLEKAIIPEEQQSTIEVEPVPEEISPVLPKVETEEDIPLLQEKKQDQEPVVLVVSESEATTSTSAEEEAKEEEEVTIAAKDQSTLQAFTTTITTTEQKDNDQIKTTESDPIAKPEEAPVKTEQAPEQAITHEDDKVPEQKEPKSLLVPQATESETKNVQEPHVSEPTITTTTTTTVNVVEEKAEPAQEQAAAPTATAPIDVSKVAPPIVVVNNVDQHQEQAQADVDVPAQTEKEIAPAVSTTTSLDKEDTPTIRSHSVLTSTNTDATIQEEDEIVTPKSSLKKKRSILGKESKSVTKRKSQILGLFKRGGDKTPPPVPELPVIQQAAEKKQPAEKKLNKRKSWMFWKSSSNNATAVATTGQSKN
ncbi:hypothetical protein MBANPS3_005106 [Mucor bainieri]